LLNTLQYLLIDEILLARVLVQKRSDQVLHEEFTDEERVAENGIGPYMEEDSEYDNNKGQPFVI